MLPSLKHFSGRKLLGLVVFSACVGFAACSLADDSTDATAEIQGPALSLQSADTTMPEVLPQSDEPLIVDGSPLEVGDDSAKPLTSAEPEQDAASTENQHEWWTETKEEPKTAASETQTEPEKLQEDIAKTE